MFDRRNVEIHTVNLSVAPENLFDSIEESKAVVLYVDDIKNLEIQHDEVFTSLRVVVDAGHLDLLAKQWLKKRKQHTKQAESVLTQISDALKAVAQVKNNPGWLEELESMHLLLANRLEEIELVKLTDIELVKLAEDHFFEQNLINMDRE